ncbi:WXG100 family type VII secretion target [Lentzea waywayandensis]|uniref:WXG100 family type VII secretion target n=1 Tax=Lentzea waywayandensis TaxID=84724 RepID=A0A1I6FJ01_9PSEU|nr:WXG100 family type VII secretion target [Lentzea waywayandensis]SFR29919.1 WXG100 family type VII secretion target [Lentzea waywayandensis]
MTSAENSVTREGMLAAAERMGQTLSAVQRERGEVEASINSLSGTFTGGAANEYKRAFTSWFANVTDIESALREMIRIMQDGAQHVGKSDADTTDEVTEASARMAGTFGGLSGL